MEITDQYRPSTDELVELDGSVGWEDAQSIEEQIHTFVIFEP